MYTFNDAAGFFGFPYITVRQQMSIYVSVLDASC